MLLFAGILAVHCQVLLGPLVYDDAHAIVQNTAIASLRNIPAFFVDPDLFSASAGRMYRPLVLTTLALEHSLGGGAAWAFKLGNLLQHLAAAALLALALPRLFRRAGLAAPDAARAGYLAVVLFAIHPLHVETLCLVSSRSEILCAIGLLIALQGWLRAGEKGQAGAAAAWVAAGTAVACLSKETGVLVPAAILMIEFVLPGPGRGCFDAARRGAARALPALAVASVYLGLRKSLLGAAAVSVRALHTGGDPLSGGARDLATQLEGMTFFLPKAVLLFFCPVPLSLDHTRFHGLGFASLPVLCGAAFVLSCAVLAVAVRRRRPLLTLAVGGSLLFGAPWILIPLNVPFAEHRLYLFVLFFTLPLAALLARASPAPRRRVVTSCGLVLWTAFLAARSVSYQHAWLDLRSLWSVALRWNPTSFRALCGLADAAIERGELWRAVNYLERACAVYPRYAPAVQNRAEIRVRLLDEAKTSAYAARTLRVAEDYAEDAWKNPFARLLAARARGGHYRFSNDSADVHCGVAWALSCLAMVAPKMLVFRTAADVLVRGGRYQEALALFDASEERGLANDEFHAHKARVLIQAGGIAEARTLLSRLLAKSPFDPLILGVKARLHGAAGEPRARRATLGILRRLGYDVSSLEGAEEAKAGN